jgi:hypothetical protein
MILITHSSDDRAVHRTGIPCCPGWGVETYRVISIKVRAVPSVTNVTVDLIWDHPGAQT